MSTNITGMRRWLDAAIDRGLTPKEAVQFIELYLEHDYGTKRLGTEFFPHLTPLAARSKARRLCALFERLSPDGVYEDDSMVDEENFTEEPPCGCMGDPDAVEHVTEYDGILERARDAFRSMMGSPLYTDGYQGKKRNGKYRKILVCGDLHIPFHDERAVRMMLEEERDIDEVVINGDLLDLMQSSHFTKPHTVRIAEDELAHARALVEEMSKMYPKVTLVKGNHDKRSEKQVQKYLPHLMPLFVSPLQLISYAVPNVNVACNPVPNSGAISDLTPEIDANFYYSVGDLLCTHLDVASKLKGVSAERSLLWMFEWMEELPMERAPKVLIQGHTHRLARLDMSHHRMAIEGACLCKPQGYVFETTGRYSPTNLGYVVITQDQEGNTLLNETRIVRLD